MSPAGCLSFIVGQDMNAIIRLLLIAASSAFVGGCVHQSSGAREWQKRDFVGHEFVIVSDTRVRWFQFTKDGVVLAGIGTKEAAAAPVYYWSLPSSSVLRIHDVADRTIAEFVIVSVDGKFFTLSDRGREERYERK